MGKTPLRGAGRWQVLLFAAILCSSCRNLLAPQALDAPTGLVATHSSSADAIELSWKTATGASSYRVYRAESYDLDADFLQIAELKQTAYSDSSVPVDTNYWYKVSALDSSGKESSFTPTAYGSRRGTGGAVAIPYAVKATKGEYGTITISWKVDVPVTKAIIFYGRNSDGSDMVKFEEIPGDGYVWKDEALWPGYVGSLDGVIFYFWVKAVSPTAPGITSALSLPDTGFSFGGEGSKPTGLVATLDLARKVSLSWNAVPRVSQYIVRRSEFIGGPDHLGLEVYHAKTTIDDPTAVPGKRYYYSVCSQATTDNPLRPLLTSSPSEAAMGSAQTIGSVPAPLNFTAARKSRFAVSLAWSPAADVTGYRIYRSDSIDGIYNFIMPDSLGTTDAAYTDIGLTPGAEYFYRVASYKMEAFDFGTHPNEGDWTDALAVTTPLTTSIDTPAAPSAATGSAPTTSLSLSWTAPASCNATGYRIYRSGSASGPFVTVGETVALAYEDGDLDPDTRYYYEISAYNADDESDRSLAASGLTDPLVPAVPAPCSAVHNGISDISVSWTKTAYADSYEIFIRTEGSPAQVPASWVKVGAAEGDQSSWSSKKDGAGNGLLCGVIYYYKIRAVNRLGEAGNYSDESDGWLMPQGFGAPPDPVLVSESTFDDLANRSAAIGWTDVHAAYDRVTGYRVFRAKIDVSTGVMTRGEYIPLADVSTNTYTQWFNGSAGFSDADKGTIYSYGVAAKDQYGNLGSRSSLPALSPLFTPHPIDLMVGRKEIALSQEENRFGMVYGQNPVSYTFTLAANTDTYLYLSHYDNIRANSAIISVKHADGTYFVNKYHPSDTLKDKPANPSLYSVDGYIISSDHDETVTLELAVQGSQVPISAYARFFVKATTSPPLNPY